MSPKHLVFALVVGLLLTLSVAGPAVAGNEGDGSGYGTQPGFEVADSKTDCAGHGAFGFFGKDWNLGNLQSGHYPGGSFPGPGADGQQTGANNSNLCGNPQNT
jgi:hypothetical protein